MPIKIDDHEDCHNNKGDQACNSGGGRANKWISAVCCEVYANGGNAVNCAVTQNCGDTAFRFQRHVGQENPHYNTKDTHHCNPCEGEAGITHAIVMADGSQWCMP